MPSSSSASRQVQCVVRRRATARGRRVIVDLDLEEGIEGAIALECIRKIRELRCTVHDPDEHGTVTAVDTDIDIDIRFAVVRARHIEDEGPAVASCTSSSPVLLGLNPDVRSVCCRTVILRICVRTMRRL